MRLQVEIYLGAIWRVPITQDNAEHFLTISHHNIVFDSIEGWLSMSACARHWTGNCMGVGVNGATADAGTKDEKANDRNWSTK